MLGKLVSRLSSMKMKLSPHEFFVTQGKGPERPFTGDYWWLQDVGTYHCKVCDSSLFPSHYKFFPTTGHASFFASHENATKVEGPEVQCNKCNSHLGLFKEQGPAPTYNTYEIKSAALLFKPMPWFTVPPTRNEIKKMNKKKKLAEKKLEVNKQ